jgi:hypothetical protein
MPLTNIKILQVRQRLTIFFFINISTIKSAYLFIYHLSDISHFNKDGLRFTYAIKKFTVLVCK